ncbi:MAG: peptidase [Spirochaetales bacterium]|uniref:Peptidase n=1 Tax=Candidatus Thalassospirochaeta sargassi TaxID=3119039 RepID=A0AAJ1ILV6_9SPIO|nr:peptidase [Spirochaetales bacterium]
MLVKCKKLQKDKEPVSTNGLIKLLLEGGLLTSSGELKEEVEVFCGGPVFRTESYEKENRYPWVFSTFDEDRDEERIDPKGWELSNYIKNPVVQWAHDHRIPAIGYAEDICCKAALAGNVVFNSKEIDPFGWSIGQRVACGALRAGSVGFLILKVEIIEDGKNSKLIFRNQELLEFSICNVPSNPFALSRTAEDEEAAILELGNTTNQVEVESYWKRLIASV